ncbi:hypothetical protein Q675_15915 [Labrenzia sp. C1B70]|nr:hypothetical protein Q675_15915 [Labrenzia sp. C1B70]
MKAVPCAFPHLARLTERRRFSLLPGAATVSA